MSVCKIVTFLLHVFFCLAVTSADCSMLKGNVKLKGGGDLDLLVLYSEQVDSPYLKRALARTEPLTVKMVKGGYISSFHLASTSGSSVSLVNSDDGSHWPYISNIFSNIKLSFKEIKSGFSSSFTPPWRESSISKISCHYHPFSYTYLVTVESDSSAAVISFNLHNIAQVKPERAGHRVNVLEGERRSRRSRIFRLGNVMIGGVVKYMTSNGDRGAFTVQGAEASIDLKNEVGLTFATLQYTLE